MKKLFSLLLLLGVLSTKAQVSPITMLPEESEGYLILNKFAYPDVKIWNVKVSQGNGEGDEYKYNLIQEYELTGVNYYRLDDKLWALNQGDYFVQVTGKDSNKDVVVSTGYVSIGTGPDYVSECKYQCVSKWYAYQIDLLISNNGGNHILQLNSAYNEAAGTGVPFYRYESLTNFAVNNFCSLNTPTNAWFG